MLAAVITPMVPCLHGIFLILSTLKLIIFSVVNTRITLSVKRNPVVTIITTMAANIFNNILHSVFYGHVPLMFRGRLCTNISFTSTILCVTLRRCISGRSIMVVSALMFNFFTHLLTLHLGLKLPIFCCDRRKRWNSGPIVY